MSVAARRGGVINRAEQLILLTRLHAAGLTAAPFVVGGRLADVSVARTSGLALMGIGLHVFACALNDVVDAPHDLTNPLRRRSPLVTGALRPTGALAIAAAGAGAYALVGWAVVGSLFGTVAATAVLVVHGYTTVAQKTSRRVAPPVMDVLFGLAMGVPMFLAGPGTENLAVPAATVLLAGAFAVHVALLNMVGGNLKDLGPDIRSGLRTTAIVLGVSSDPNGTVRFTRRYCTVAYTAQALGGGFLVAAIAASGSTAPTGFAALVSVAAVLVTQSMAGRDLARCFAGARPPSMQGREPFIAANLCGWLVVATAVGGLNVLVAFVVALVVPGLGATVVQRRSGAGRA